MTQTVRSLIRRAPISTLFLSLSGLLLAPASLCLAEDYQAENAGMPEAQSELEEEVMQPLLTGIQPRQERPLSLAEAVAIGLKNNLNVEVQRYAPATAELSAEQAWGAYDPTLNGEVGYLSSTQPNSNGILGVAQTKQRVFDHSIGLMGMVPWLGATVGVDVVGSDTSSNTRVTALDPDYDTSIGVSASIPLLRGLIWNSAWTNVKTSDRLKEASYETFRNDVMDTVQSIEQGYWDLVARWSQLQVARVSLQTAEALLDQTKTQYEVGVKSKVEVVEAEAGVAERAFNLILAQHEYYGAQDRLVDRVLGISLTDTSNLAFLPTDDPEQIERLHVDIADAVRTAMALRPDLAATRRDLERIGYNLKWAKNQRLPQLDVIGSYGAAGKSGVSVTNPAVACADPEGPDPNDPGCLVQQGANPFIPVSEPGSPLIDGSWGDSYNNITGSRGGDEYVVRAQFSIPFPNTTARKEVTKTQIELRRANSVMKRLEQQIILEVRNTARGLESSYRGIDAAERRRLAAAEQLRAEKIRLEHGESTPFDVLLREQDFREAESQKINALQAYQNSETAFERAIGTLLDEHQIVIEEVRALR